MAALQPMQPSAKLQLLIGLACMLSSACNSRARASHPVSAAASPTRLLLLLLLEGCCSSGLAPESHHMQGAEGPRMSFEWPAAQQPPHVLRMAGSAAGRWAPCLSPLGRGANPVDRAAAFAHSRRPVPRLHACTPAAHPAAQSWPPGHHCAAPRVLLLYLQLHQYPPLRCLGLHGGPLPFLEKPPNARSTAPLRP
jgi:hypothetical protein